MFKPARKLVFLMLMASAAACAAAEEFKYYVWIDEQGIVHAEEEAPKGRDYQVRIIEDVNANVVPSEDFRPYGDLPIDYEAGDSGTAAGQPAASGEAAPRESGATAAQQ